jgi:hypothetical protein
MTIETGAHTGVVDALARIVMEMYQQGSHDKLWSAPSPTIRVIVEGKTNGVEIEGVISNLDTNTNYDPSFQYMGGGFGRGGHASLGMDVTLKLLPSSAREYKKENTKETDMFSKHIITSVTTAAVNPIALELAVKKLAAGSSKFQIVERKDVWYLIADGADPLELDGDALRAALEAELVGKTLGDIRANSGITSLIQNLGLIETITLTKPKTSLADLLR